MSATNLSALRTGLAAAVISVAVASAAHADFVNASADPFLGGSINLTSPNPLAIGPSSAPFGYTTTFTVAAFKETSQTFSGGNEYVTYTTSFGATLYTDTSLTTIAQSILLSGTFAATVDGRNSATQTGTFSEVITEATFSGEISGQSVSNYLQNPVDTTVAISALTGGNYQISYSAGASVPAMMEVETVIQGPAPLTPTYSQDIPEPASLTLLGVSLAGLSVLRHRRAPRVRAA
jgi:hypothetical protein